MLRFALDHPTLRVGLVRADTVRFAPSSEPLLAELARAEARVRADPSAFPEQVRAALRDVLRVGGYKPTGRGKPASELLLAMALGEGLPHIGNLVDINNLVSLESAHPISIFDADLLGDDITLRFGRPGERYVFNASGHSMELAGLPVICRQPVGRADVHSALAPRPHAAGERESDDASRARTEGEPVGNAVRDSMSCKVHARTERALAIVYGSSRLPQERLLHACERLSALLRAHAGAEHVRTEHVP